MLKTIGTAAKQEKSRLTAKYLFLIYRIRFDLIVDCLNFFLHSKVSTDPDGEINKEEDGNINQYTPEGMRYPVHTITSIDATYILRYNAEIDVWVDMDMLMHGDVDGSGDLEIVDATFIQRWLSEFNVPYDIGEQTTA